VFQKRTTLTNLGDVTVVLSKKRRNAGPKHVRLFVTNLDGVTARTVLSLYAWRWGVEVTIKELKGGLHLGQMHVTRDADRVARAETLSEFFRRLHLEEQVACSPSTLRTVMHLLERLI
jgi:hypothetical protein